jgi:MFS family permease
MGPVIYTFTQAIVIPTIVPVAQSMHISRLDGTWVLTSFLLSGAVVTPLAGRLGDLLGNRRVLLWILWLTAAGGVLSGVSTSFVPVVLGRVLAGTCTATMALGYGIMRENLANDRLAPVVAFVSVSIAVGTALGNLLAGVIESDLGTRWLFLIPLLMTLPACLMAQLWVPESPVRTRTPVHWLGAVTMSVALLSVLVAISESTTWGWGSARTLGLLAFGAIALVTWVLVELRAAHPLIDMRVMALPGVWRTNAVSFLFGFGLFGTFVALPQFVETPHAAGYGFGASVTAAAIILLPANLVTALGGPLAGRLERRFSPKLPLFGGGAIGIVGYLMISLLSAHRPALYPAMFLLGIGMGVGYAVLPHVIVRSVPREHTGGASGINVIARNIGGATGIQVGATVLAAHTAAGRLFPTHSGFTLVFWLLAGAAICATAGTLAIPTHRRSPAAQPQARLA